MFHFDIVIAWLIFADNLIFLMDGTYNKSNQTGRKLGGNIFRKFNMYLLFDCYYQCLNATFTIIIDIVVVRFVLISLKDFWIIWLSILFTMTFHFIYYDFPFYLLWLSILFTIKLNS
jgi:hypothetical protein